MASKTYTTAEGCKRPRNTYHTSTARRAMKLAPIGFDDSPPDDYVVVEPTAKPRKMRRQRKARPIRTNRKRFQAETWKGVWVVIDYGENAKAGSYESHRDADKAAAKLNRSYKRDVRTARRAVA